jgi:hypothetical protein
MLCRYIVTSAHGDNPASQTHSWSPSGVQNGPPEEEFIENLYRCYRRTASHIRKNKFVPVPTITHRCNFHFLPSLNTRYTVFPLRYYMTLLDVERTLQKCDNTMTYITLQNVFLKKILIVFAIIL